MTTIAGHAVTAEEAAGGLLRLRIALGPLGIPGLVRALKEQGGVRLSSGPNLGREASHVAHCPGFKLVLGGPEQPAMESVVALVSRAPADVDRQGTSPLADVLAELMSRPLPARAPEGARTPKAPSTPPARQATFARGTPLARGAPLARKASLARKTPLTRKTPLARGKKKPR